MEITWLGHSCFLIRGKDKAIITDPCHPDLGYRLGEPEADIVTLSHFHRGHAYVEGVANDPKQIRSPGEYEIGGTFITGIASFHDNKKGEVRGKNTVYVIEMDGVTLCHLGDLGHPLDSHLVEEIGDVGILLLPVGEVSTIPIDTGAEIIRQLEPSVVIPMHYKTKVLAGNLSPVDKFLDAMRIRGLEAKPKLSITASSLPGSTQTIVLSHASGPISEVAQFPATWQFSGLAFPPAGHKRGIPVSLCVLRHKRAAVCYFCFLRVPMKASMSMAARVMV